MVFERCCTPSCILHEVVEDYLHMPEPHGCYGLMALSVLPNNIQVKKHFKNIGVAADDKYIDPTYMICACLTSASVSILCAALGQNVVHVGSSLERHEPAKPLHVDLTTINE
ncbi:unnamed protein product [Sphagnum troendelagicum]|uniref:Uncharacterized protein n=1 Tax=Sphagnum troendelagicum TaxID=128251 RepID=A0ABP0TYN3_9BRYO